MSHQQNRIFYNRGQLSIIIINPVVGSLHLWHLCDILMGGFTLNPITSLLWSESFINVIEKCNRHCSVQVFIYRYTVLPNADVRFLAILMVGHPYIVRIMLGYFNPEKSYVFYTNYSIYKCIIFKDVGYCIYNPAPGLSLSVECYI